MRLLHHLAIAAVLAPLVAPAPASAQDAGPNIYMVNYIEAGPGAKGQVAGLLRQLANASRKEAGALRFEVLQRTDPSSHFAILEVWKDQQALEAHVGTVHTKHFRTQLQPLLIAPFGVCASVWQSTRSSRRRAGAGVT